MGLYNDSGVVENIPGQWRTSYRKRTHEEFLTEIEQKHTAAGFVPMNFGGPGGSPLNNHNSAVRPEQAGGVYDPFGVVPDGLETFKEVLRRMTQGHALGVITAVTNQDQTNAAKHLEACGFDVSIKTNKHGYTNGPWCTHWHGDWHKKVAPAIQVTPLPAG